MMNQRKTNDGRGGAVMARAILWGAVAVSGLCSASQASAADDAASYPTRPIRLVLPFPPGGGTDTLARIMAPKMGQILGQSVVVDNRVGASGNIATDIVAHANPDGYTALMGFSTALTINPVLYKNLNFDVQRDLKPVTLLASAQYVLVVTSTLPVKSVKDLIKYAKAHPGQLNFSSSGAGSPLHLSGELFQYMTHTKMTHIPYKGGGPAVLALLGGQVQVLFGSIAAVMPHVREGKLRALAVTSPKRSPIVPDLPTLSEEGLPGFDVTTWYGLLVPKNTPDAIIAKLQSVAQKVVQEPDVQKAMGEQGLDLALENPPEFGKRIESENLFWTDLIHKLNITANN
jgi:tripartite-type tricarboxylate transporter receptor subunit TctC